MRPIDADVLDKKIQEWIACKNSDTREAACKPIWNGRCD